MPDEQTSESQGWMLRRVILAQVEMEVRIPMDQQKAEWHIANFWRYIYENPLLDVYLLHTRIIQLEAMLLAYNEHFGLTAFKGTLAQRIERGY